MTRQTQPPPSRDACLQREASQNIYHFVRCKLETHGAGRTADGRQMLAENSLFLGFVRLERARRAKNFDAVQSATALIEARATAMGKRHLVIFAYLYLCFDDATPLRWHSPQVLPNGGTRICVDYRKPVTAQERLIFAWAEDRYERLRAALFRALYAGEPEAD